MFDVVCNEITDGYIILGKENVKKQLMIPNIVVGQKIWNWWLAASVNHNTLVTRDINIDLAIPSNEGGFSKIGKKRKQPYFR